MGNSCAAREHHLTPQQELNPAQKANAVPRIQTSGTSDFLPKMNVLLSRSDHSKVGLSSKYVPPKVLDQDGTIMSSELEIFTTLLRTQLKGNLFLHQNEVQVLSDPNENRQNVRQLDKKLTAEDIRQISSILDSHFLFLQLSTVEKVETIKSMRLFEADAGSFIFRQGDNAERFFIISEGEIEIIIDGESKKTLGKNQSFGEIALLFGTKRTASIRALVGCKLWGIDGESFKRIVNEINLKTQKQNRQFLEKTSFFNDLTPIQQQSVMNVIVILEYKPGDIITNLGATSNSFCIIKSGEVTVESKDGGQVDLAQGNDFGEKSFDSFREKRIQLVKAKTDCTIICIGKEQIAEALGYPIQDVILKNRIKRIIEDSKRFRVISHKNIDQYVQEYSIKPVTQGQKILKKGHTMKCIYIPFDIEMSASDKKYLAGEIIEENILVEGKPLNHGIKADSTGSLLVIKPRPNILNEVKNFHSDIDPNQLSLDNIQIIKKIGSGQFGEVYVGIHLKSNSLVAIKSVSKKTVDKYHIERQIINEHMSMKNINHPFLIKYHKTFVSKREIHFLIEYIEGLEFFDIIRKIGILTSNQAQFYAGQILLALEYLHNKNIVYRDLKPENIMVEKNGYLKLIDMGTAKVLDKEGYYKTRTVIGTPHYMAPEAISGKGYSFLVDLWSLGIVLYELVAGYFPYEQKHNDPFQIYKLIMNKSLEFPGYIKDKDVKQIITKLLSKAPENRMSKGYDELKRMEFFKDLDWTELENKRISPVYKISQNAGININEIHRESLETMLEYFDKRMMNLSKGISSKFIGWEKDLL